MLSRFIDVKSRQLVFYLSRFLRGHLPYRELHLFVWDTLEEWSQLRVHDLRPESFKEQVFWHLLYQIEYWSEPELRHNKLLRRELQYCLGFLYGHGDLPLSCVGVRP
ncbi:hypothetical protein [Rheinheimera sp.]|uniref:hypothetical protein n=1 Tax=Rheinheimera sp. TaxID=1869214 RepID=UPI00307EA3C9